MNMTDFDDDGPLDEEELIHASSADSPEDRADRATELLDDMGLISGGAGVTSNAILFVEDMQRRLRDCRARRTSFYCSERQLEWLEAIYEKVS
jgi:hypothetical protein